MSEVTALIAEIKSKGLLRAGDKLEELYVVAARIQDDNLELKAQRDALAAVPVYQYESGIYNEENGDTDWYWDDCDKGFYDQYEPSRRRILFTRPAPAASLAELVPDEFTNDEVPCAMTDVIQAEMDGWNACRAAILRNIEEANK